jgi:hypothetical protein
MFRLRALIGILLVAGILGASTALPTGVQAQLTGEESTIEGVCRVTQNLRLRSGPGVTYEIITRLPVDTNLAPLERNAASSWLYVLVLGTESLGWVGYSPEWLECNVQIDQLQVATGPADGGGGDAQTVSGGAVPDAGAGRDLVGVVFAQGPHTYNSDEDDELLTFLGDFSLQLVVWDPRMGSSDGDGIARVQFRIYGPDDDEPVYEKFETTPEYCLFGGAAPCEGQRLFAGARWRDTNLPIENGSHQIEIVAYPTDPNRDEEQWRFEFDIQR